MFGKRIEARDEACICVAYEWLGCVYVVDVKEIRGKAYKIRHGVVL